MLLTSICSAWVLPNKSSRVAHTDMGSKPADIRNCVNVSNIISDICIKWISGDKSTLMKWILINQYTKMQENAIIKLKMGNLPVLFLVYKLVRVGTVGSEELLLSFAT